MDICYDIAVAIAYLHSNGIIHWDLSGNNVLIIAKRRAKITDFGMSKLTSGAQTMTPLTMCPGTLAYMPPEALEEPPMHTKKLDCFSQGVIIIKVVTRKWPDPGPRVKSVQNCRSPTGMIQIPVLEPERRKSHIDTIDRSHTLLPLAMDCLRYKESDRPSSEEVCQRLFGLKKSAEYRESVQHIDRVHNDTEPEVLQTTIQKLEKLADENRQLQTEVQSKDYQTARYTDCRVEPFA